MIEFFRILQVMCLLVPKIMGSQDRNKTLGNFKSVFQDRVENNLNKLVSLDIVIEKDGSYHCNAIGGTVPSGNTIEKAPLRGGVKSATQIHNGGMPTVQKVLRLLDSNGGQSMSAEALYANPAISRDIYWISFKSAIGRCVDIQNVGGMYSRSHGGGMVPLPIVTATAVIDEWSVRKPIIETLLSHRDLAASPAPKNGRQMASAVRRGSTAVDADATINRDDDVYDCGLFPVGDSLNEEIVFHVKVQFVSSERTVEGVVKHVKDLRTQPGGDIMLGSSSSSSSHSRESFTFFNSCVSGSKPNGDSPKDRMRAIIEVMSRGTR